MESQQVHTEEKSNHLAKTIDILDTISRTTTEHKLLLEIAKTSPDVIVTCMNSIDSKEEEDACYSEYVELSTQYNTIVETYGYEKIPSDIMYIKDGLIVLFKDLASVSGHQMQNAECQEKYEAIMDDIKMSLGALDYELEWLTNDIKKQKEAGNKNGDE